MSSWRRGHCFAFQVPRDSVSRGEAENMGSTEKETEWIGGLTMLPVGITESSPQFRPEALLWLTADGLVVGQDLAPAGQLLGRASEHLRRTIEKPMEGPTPAPTRVRVATTELADALRVGHPGLQIVVAPTPEIDAIVGALSEQLADSDSSYLDGGVTPDSVAAFFRASAELWRAHPWDNLDTDLVLVSSRALGLSQATLFLVSASNGPRGWLLFKSHQEFLTFTEAENDEDAALPMLAVNFEYDGDLSDLERDEISEHGWEVASPKANPVLNAVDENGNTRAPTTQELQRAEALSLGLAELVEQGRPHLKLNLKTDAGAVDLIVTAIDANPEDREERGPADLDAPHALAKLLKLELISEHRGDEGAELNEQILRLFQESPEAKALPRVEFISFLMESADEVFDTTIGNLGSVELSEIVFTIFAETGVTDRSNIVRVIAELRAFYSFLEREFGLKQAGNCLLILDEGAEVLRRMSDAGRRRPQAAAEKKKKKRKMEKKARRKNRR